MKRRGLAQLRHEFVFQMVASNGPARLVDVLASWTADDPYVVTLDFDRHTDDHPRWLVGRCLLAEGLIQATGLGDVRVYPVPGDPQRVGLELSAPSGRATFTIPAGDLARFIQASWSVVPDGQESAWPPIPNTPAELIEQSERGDL